MKHIGSKNGNNYDYNDHVPGYIYTNDTPVRRYFDENHLQQNLIDQTHENDINIYPRYDEPFKSGQNEKYYSPNNIITSNFEMEWDPKPIPHQDRSYDKHQVKPNDLFHDPVIYPQQSRYQINGYSNDKFYENPDGHSNQSGNRQLDHYSHSPRSSPNHNYKTDFDESPNSNEYISYGAHHNEFHKSPMTNDRNSEEFWTKQYKQHSRFTPKTAYPEPHTYNSHGYTGQLSASHKPLHSHESYTERSHLHQQLHSSNKQQSININTYNHNAMTANGASSTAISNHYRYGDRTVSHGRREGADYHGNTERNQRGVSEKRGSVVVPNTAAVAPSQRHPYAPGKYAY